MSPLSYMPEPRQMQIYGAIGKDLRTHSVSAWDINRLGKDPGNLGPQDPQDSLRRASVHGTLWLLQAIHLYVRQNSETTIWTLGELSMDQ